MKWLYCILIALASVRPCSAQSGTESLTVEVGAAGLRNRNGQVVFCLWREADPGFPKPDRGQPFRKLSVPASVGKAIFQAVPPGTYAISLFHDEKGTGKVETNLMGMPKGGIGISGEFSGPPRFAKAKLALAKDSTITIEIRYF